MGINNMKSSLVAIALSTLALSCAASGADVAAEKEDTYLKNATQTCVSCHGVNGRSVSAIFPNLAAQTAPYLETQLKAFKNQSRSDPDAQAYMWGMASQLSDAMIGKLAVYFEKQPAPPPGETGDRALMAQGKKVFEEGLPAQKVQACATCHGDHAQGLAYFPRLAGQHAPYLLKQLLVIQNALRNAPVMHGVVKDLTREQMLAVSAYLESI